MINWNLFLPPSFFSPNRPIYKEPEAAPAAAEDADNISGSLRALEDSGDAEFLRGVLTGWIEDHHPGLGDQLSGQSVGDLLDAMAELGGVEEGDTRAVMAQGLIEKALKHRYPNGDRHAQEVLDRVSSTLRSSPSPRSDTKARGDALIDRHIERINSSRLEDLKRKLAGLQETYDTYVEVANKAAIEMMKRESFLRKLMEQQGFQYDRNEETENFYYFSDDHKLVWGDEPRERTEAELDAVEQATHSWQSMAWHFDRSNAVVERTEKKIEKVEAQIRAEEAQLNKNK